MKPWTFAACVFFTAGIALYEPVHAWLHLHRTALLWFTIGTWVELFACQWRPLVKWIRDRRLWLRWFSHQ